MPDFDALPALAPERESLWASLEKTSFLTPNEKRVTAGFPELDGANELKFAGLDPKANFNPGQLRVPAGQPNGGQWGGEGSIAPQPAQAGRGRGSPGTPAQQARLAGATTSARSFVRQTRELDPTWQPPQSITSTIEGEIAHQEAIARAAQARYAELTRDAIPAFNPSWGVNRSTRELHERGFRLERSTDSPELEYENPQTGERVRIMERPTQRWDNDPPQKHYFENYYRYREK